MKELSIEEKARRYDEAIEVARDSYNYPSYPGFIRADVVFPELKESEDERIRKALIDYFDDANKVDENPLELYGIHTDKVLAWLEKQKTSNEALQYLKENHSPSEMSDFQAAMNIAVVKAFDAGKKQGEQKSIDKVEPKFKVGDWAVFNGLILHIDEVEDSVYTTTSLAGIHNSYDWEIDKIARRWAIQDAKDGYTLSWDDSNCIALFKNIYNEDSFSSYGFVGHCTGIFECKNTYHSIEGVHPATEEQRELLFQKMKEAGYTWDAEKKKLEKTDKEINGEDYGIDSLYHAQRILEKTLGKVDGYQSDDGILEHKCAISAVKKLYEQKFWSEEDEKHYQGCSNLMRLSLDTKPYPYYNDYLWFKSIKSRYTWKPSDEQMEALDIAIRCGIQLGTWEEDALKSLKEQLKKLMEK